MFTLIRTRANHSGTYNNWADYRVPVSTLRSERQQLAGGNRQEMKLMRYVRKSSLRQLALVFVAAALAATTVSFAAQPAQAWSDWRNAEMFKSSADRDRVDSTPRKISSSGSLFKMERFCSYWVFGCTDTHWVGGGNFKAMYDMGHALGYYRLEIQRPDSHIDYEGRTRWTICERTINRERGDALPKDATDPCPRHLGYERVYHTLQSQQRKKSGTTTFRTVIELFGDVKVIAQGQKVSNRYGIVGIGKVKLSMRYKNGRKKGLTQQPTYFSHHPKHRMMGAAYYTKTGTMPFGEDNIEAWWREEGKEVYNDLYGPNVGRDFITSLFEWFSCAGTNSSLQQASACTRSVGH